MNNPPISAEIVKLLRDSGIQSGYGGYYVDVTHVTPDEVRRFRLEFTYNDSFAFANVISLHYPADGVKIYSRRTFGDGNDEGAVYLNTKPKMAAGQQIIETPETPEIPPLTTQAETSKAFMLLGERIEPGDAVLMVRLDAGHEWEDFIPLNEQEEADEALNILEVGWDHPPNKVLPQNFQIRYKPVGSYQWKIKSYVPPAEPVKPTWQMTKAEYMQRNYDPVRDSVAKRGVIEANHRDIVKSALQEGKPVPADVMKDYPDLQNRIRAADVKTIADADRYRHENPIDGVIQSRYRTMVNLFGETNADRMMRELEVQSWGRPGSEEPVIEPEVAKLYRKQSEAGVFAPGHWSEMTDALVKLTLSNLDILRDRLQNQFDDSPVRMNGTKTEEIKSFINWAKTQERFNKVIELARQLRQEVSKPVPRVITEHQVQLRPEEVRRLLPEVDRVIYELTHHGEDKMRNPKKFMESVTVRITPAVFSPSMAETEFAYLFSWNGRSLESGPGWSQDSLPNMPDVLVGQERMINVPPGRRVWEVVYSGAMGGYWSRVNVYVNPADWPKYLP